MNGERPWISNDCLFLRVRNTLSTSGYVTNGMGSFSLSHFIEGASTYGWGHMTTGASNSFSYYSAAAFAIICGSFVISPFDCIKPLSEEETDRKCRFVLLQNTTEASAERCLSFNCLASCPC